MRQVQQREITPQSLRGRVAGVEALRAPSEDSWHCLLGAPLRRLRSQPPDRTFRRGLPMIRLRPPFRRLRSMTTDHNHRLKNPSRHNGHYAKCNCPDRQEDQQHRGACPKLEYDPPGFPIRDQSLRTKRIDRSKPGEDRQREHRPHEWDCRKPRPNFELRRHVTDSSHGATARCLLKKRRRWATVNIG